MTTAARRITPIAVLTLACAGGVLADAHVAMLPPGPIKERHEIMDVTVSDAAKTINQALKQGKTAEIPKQARIIAGVMDRFITLFPAGSTDPESLAKPEIWQNKAEFDALAMKSKEKANELAQTAESGGDVKAATRAMFGACKACHDKFRVPPEEDE